MLSWCKLVLLSLCASGAILSLIFRDRMGHSELSLPGDHTVSQTIHMVSTCILHYTSSHFSSPHVMSNEEKAPIGEGFEVD